ncbi:hypothetical protein TYRP_017036 [Tyrophagus putrescentiae]|nr:hypothetical protein TYRP_017036 [Tyrophagus putrescentiae]
MANASWLVVCCSSSTAVVLLLIISVVQADFKRTSPLVASAAPIPGGKNASSSTYFQQVFSKEKAGETSTKIGGHKTSPRPSNKAAESLSSSEAETPSNLENSPSPSSSSKSGNLTGSEARNVYDYEPFQKSDGDNEGGDGGGDDYENDDNDDKDYYDDDSGEGDNGGRGSPQDEYSA